jgi:hypothetical protein
MILNSNFNLKDNPKTNNAKLGSLELMVILSSNEISVQKVYYLDSICNYFRYDDDLVATNKKVLKANYFRVHRGKIKTMDIHFIVIKVCYEFYRINLVILSCYCYNFNQIAIATIYLLGRIISQMPNEYNHFL